VQKKSIPCAEYKILESLKPFLNFKKTKRYPLPIGDDAAIRFCENNEQLIFTTDSFVQGTHFSFEYMTPQEIGYKAMAINLSDCASMGAIPDGALISIIFPKNAAKTDIDRKMQGIYKGLNEACVAWNFPIIGGNLASGPCWIIDITLIGSGNAKQPMLLRTGAKNNDNLWITGSPGQSSAGLSCLLKWKQKRNIPKHFLSLVKQHVIPAPRIDIGCDLRANPHVHAMLDVSDGISKECNVLSYENNLGIFLDNATALLTQQMIRLGMQLKVDPFDWLLYGGEDYELLFCASEKFNPAPLIKKYGVPVTRIGRMEKSAAGVFMTGENGKKTRVEKKGWDHIN